MNKVTVFAIALTVGCSANDRGEFSTTQQLIANAAPIEVPAPYGSARWFEVGDITVLPEGTPAALQAEDASQESAEEEPSAEPAPTIGVDDLVAGKRYALVFPDGFGEGFPTQSPSTDPDIIGVPDTEDLPSAPVIEKGWSDNDANGIADDNRTDLSGSTLAIYRRFGWLNTGCSATMIQQSANGTFALTAAHCVYSTSGSPIFATFEPARGNTASTGRWDITSITRYEDWINNTCYSGTQPSSCRRYDIAIIKLTPRTGTTYLGGMAYGWFTPTHINSKTKYHRGYPGCTQAGAPAGCVGNRLWGDNAHSNANYAQGDRLFDLTSDVSRGHSGGPQYFVSDGQNYIYGVASGERCEGSGCNGVASQPYVNIAVTIREDWFNLLFDMIN